MDKNFSTQKKGPCKCAWRQPQFGNDGGATNNAVEVEDPITPPETGLSYLTKKKIGKKEFVYSELITENEFENAGKSNTVTIGLYFLDWKCWSMLMVAMRWQRDFLPLEWWPICSSVYSTRRLSTSDFFRADWPLFHCPRGLTLPSFRLLSTRRTCS